MASSFLIAGSGVKTKWQYLRDTYRRELAKTNQPTGSHLVVIRNGSIFS